MTPLTLAIDVGPLYGHRTGVAVATSHLLDGLAAHPEVTVVPYLLSARARPRPGHVRLPLPAAAALRIWSRIDHPRMDRWCAGAEVVHGTNYVAPPSRRPRVISVYDCWFLRHPRSASPAVNRSAAVLRRAVAHGAHLHVSSAATAAAAAELLATDRISVIHLGPPDSQEAAPDPAITAARLQALGLDPERHAIVLAIGTIERRKDIGSLVEAFGLFAADHADAHLVIAGAPGDDIERVRAAIERLRPPIRSRVHLLGSVDQPTKMALMSAATVLAYPSLDEGFGFPILEANTARVPVVARPVGSIPEVGGTAVHLAADGSVASLAEATAAVLADGGLRNSLVAAGTANLSRFSWDRCTGEMLTLYRQLRGDRHD